jgi:hypothetical protein
MRYVIIEDGVVTNAAVADEPLGSNWLQSDTADIGDLYDGENFSKPPTPQEVIDEAWKALRLRRDGLLSLSDWTQLPDNPLNDTQRAEAVAYRQALRDFPETCQDPLNAVWPEAPSFLG